MTYRSDLDALAAREAALAKEVDEKSKERDDLAKQLAEAREREAAEAREREAAERRAANAGRRKRTRLWIAGAVGVSVLVAGGAGFVMSRKHVSSSSVTACWDLMPAHRKFEAATAKNYDRALAAKGLSPISLQTIEIGSIGEDVSTDEVTAAMGQSADPWQVIPYTFEGKRRAAVVGELQNFETSTEPDEFAADAHGNVWHVRRAPHQVTVMSVKVETCYWGCFGQEPSGAEMPPGVHRYLWLLRDGETFRGNVEIKYDAPTIVEHPTENCPPPQ